MLDRLDFRPSVPVFDGHVQAGRPHDRPVPVSSREELLARMDQWGIERALVYHPSALFYDGEWGNADLMEWIGDESRLVPQWCAHLSLTDHEAFARQTDAAGVRAVRIAPRLGLYPFAPWVVDEWLGWLSETGRGLWVSLDEVDAGEFHTAVERHPQLRVVLSDGHYRHHAVIWPLMRALPNLTLELSRYDVADGVRRLVDAFGPHRFVFGSTYPDLAPEPYLFYLHHAGLDDEALRAITAGNLERLLFMIVDFHAHLGSWRQYGMDDSLPHLLGCMDRSGVDRACLFHVFRGDHRRSNDEVAAAVRAHPDRFIGFAFVTPHYPEEMVAELCRALDELGLKALKIYPPYVGVPVTEAVWAPLFEEADRRGLVVISHTGHGDPSCDPGLFDTLAERYPNVRWVLGHAGITYPGRVTACEVARRRPNVYLEICTSWRNPGSIEQLVEGAGEERVLFGSDMPLLEPAVHVGRIVTAALPEGAKRKLLGENALRLLGLEAGR